MDNFIYSLNATLPIFLMILLGKVLIKLKIIDLPFTKVVDRFVFCCGTAGSFIQRSDSQ